MRGVHFKWMRGVSGGVRVRGSSARGFGVSRFQGLSVSSHT